MNNARMMETPRQAGREDALREAPIYSAHRVVRAPSLTAAESARRPMETAIPGAAPQWTRPRESRRPRRSSNRCCRPTPHTGRRRGFASRPGSGRSSSRLTASTPRCWIDRAAAKRRCGRGTSLAGAAGAARYAAARAVAADSGVLLTAFAVGAGHDFEDPSGSWAEPYGVDDGGEVLVRPGGYVASRSRGESRQLGAVLWGALRRILARDA